MDLVKLNIMRIDTVLASASSGRLATLARAGVKAEVIVSDFAEEDFISILQSFSASNVPSSNAPIGSGESIFSPAQVVSLLALGKALKVIFPGSEPEHILSQKSFLSALQNIQSTHISQPGLSVFPLNISSFVEEYQFQINPALLSASAEKVVIACDSMLLLNNQLVGKPHTTEKAWQQIRALRQSSPTLYSGHVICHLNSASQIRFAVGVSRSLVHFGNFSDQEIESYIATGEPLQVAGGFTIDGLGGAFIDGIEGDYHGIVGLSLPLTRKLLADLEISWTDLWEKP